MNNEIETYTIGVIGFDAGVIFQHVLSGTALQPLIDGLLQTRPDDRFQSTFDVLDGIEWMTHGSV